jgi:hypothetical protein
MAVSCTSLYQRFVIKLGVQLPELSLPHSSLFSKSTACSSGAFFVQQAGGSCYDYFLQGLFYFRKHFYKAVMVPVRKQD